MNEDALRSALMKMKAGDCRPEKWFISQGLTKEDLSTAVELNYLIPQEKDPNDFMSDKGFMLTQTGRDFAWS